MGLPNRKGRLAILNFHMKRYRMEPDLDLEKLLPELLAWTEGASGADLAYLCEAAARACVKAGVEPTGRGVPPLRSVHTRSVPRLSTSADLKRDRSIEPRDHFIFSTNWR